MQTKTELLNKLDSIKNQVSNIKRYNTEHQNSITNWLKCIKDSEQTISNNSHVIENLEATICRLECELNSIEEKEKRRQQYLILHREFGSPEQQIIDVKKENVVITAENNLLGLPLDKLFVRNHTDAFMTIRGEKLEINKNVNCERLGRICYKFRNKDTRFCDASLAYICKQHFNLDSADGNRFGALRYKVHTTMRGRNRNGYLVNMSAYDAAVFLEEFYVKLFGNS